MPISDISKIDLDDPEALLSNCGFQATHLARGISIIREMKKQKAKVFLTFTSNLVASGLRGIITQMCREKFVDCIITAGGSIDHDIIKSKLEYELGEFIMDDTKLHAKGTNRLGNILINNKCYAYLEEFIYELFDDIYVKEGNMVSPSAIARVAGEKTKPDSFLYWCTKNKIPVYSPGITDSAIGLQTYFYKQRKKDFGIDVTKDMKALAQIALDADKAGGIVLGGGISKHHAIGVNLLRGGFDYAVYVTTASPWD